MLLRVLFSALAAFACAVAHAASCGMDDDRVAIVNGERTFILGLYENPSDDAVLQQAAEAGFNLVQAQPSTESLDRLHALGLFAWINTGSQIETPADSPALLAALQSFIEKFRDHPALLVWEVPDEALWNTWYLAQLWRHNEEPKLLEEKIGALADEAKQKQLRADLAQARALNGEGYYAEAEAMADAIWAALGEKSPKPDYGLANAQARAEALLNDMMLGRQLLRATDPIHPVWMNHAPRNTLEQLAAFGNAADIVGCDIYPVPFHHSVQHSDLANRSLSCVGDYTKRMMLSAPGKPVWMVLQGFGWKDLNEDRPDEIRRPTKAETRFMAWDAIIHGATGILYWGTAYIEKDSTLWTELLEVVRELADSEDIILAPGKEAALVHAPSFGSRDRGVLALHKTLPDRDVLLLVNEDSTPHTVTLRYLDALNGKTFQARHYEKARATVNDGQAAFTIPPYTVYILEEEK